MAAAAGHDINYVAMSGLLSTFGPVNSMPSLPHNLVADFAGGGLMCAFGVLVALMHRQSSGHGQVIDVSMTHGMFLPTAIALIHSPCTTLNVLLRRSLCGLICKSYARFRILVVSARSRPS